MSARAGSQSISGAMYSLVREPGHSLELSRISNVILTLDHLQGPLLVLLGAGLDVDFALAASTYRLSIALPTFISQFCPGRAFRVVDDVCDSSSGATFLDS